MLDRYDFDPLTGRWTHREGRVPPPMSLHDVAYGAGGLVWPQARLQVPDDELEEVLDEARTIIRATRPPDAQPRRVVLAPEVEALRWFPLPGEGHPDASGTAPEPEVTTVTAPEPEVTTGTTGTTSEPDEGARVSP